MSADQDVSFHELLEQQVAAVRVRGSIDALRGVELLRELIARARARGWHRMLVDFRETRVSGPFINGYDAAKRMIEVTGAQYHERVAFVYSAYGYDPARAKGIENAANNWGQPPLRGFATEADALEWLRTA